MKPAISIEGLSKQYYVGARKSEGYRTLRESLVDALTATWRRARRASTGRLRREGEGCDSAEAFWALQDVSFEVQPGEVVGIIGRNGAGKSTLLKILSRITEPSRGRVELRGRIASLLEVGTGFHPELTGRENIFLNGAILGMTRAEVGRKFDEIVAFAEIDRHLDTPVKRYSSGMYVRLAFAVAAHLEPEILVVDEVLAVGDMAFQRKCLGRMREVSRGGRTVLFVSHNLASVEALCDRGVLLQGGQLARLGPVRAVVRAYHQSLHGSTTGGAVSLAELDGPERHQKILRHAVLLDEAGEPTQYVPLGGTFRLRIGLDVDHPIDLPTLGIGIDDSLDQRLLSLHTPISRNPIRRIDGDCEAECRVPTFPLAPGDYWVKLAVSVNGNDIDSVERVLCFTVGNADAFGQGRGFHRGVCVAPSEWGLVRESRCRTKERLGCCRDDGVDG
jgi:lipopolysaccharide transport system ATP-binding protein